MGAFHVRTSLDCIPCIIRQTLDAARMVSEDTAVHERIVSEVVLWIREMTMEESPPVIGQRIHRRLRQMTGVQDPYRTVKDLQNQTALGLLPELRAEIAGASDPLAMALRLAIAGNVIDVGLDGSITDADVRESIRHAMTTPFQGSWGDFLKAVASARSILYLADNAGEIAFDRLLIEQLSPERVVVAVRGAPVLNDATMADAKDVGLDQIVEVIDNGSDAPGTILDECGPEFRRRFSEVDLVIAKGQGNFETLNTVTRDIFFLFKAKCSVIAESVGVPVGTHVLARSAWGASAYDERPRVRSNRC